MVNYENVNLVLLENLVEEINDVFKGEVVSSEVLCAFGHPYFEKDMAFLYETNNGLRCCTEDKSFNLLNKVDYVLNLTFPPNTIIVILI